MEKKPINIVVNLRYNAEVKIKLYNMKDVISYADLIKLAQEKAAFLDNNEFKIGDFNQVLSIKKIDLNENLQEISKEEDFSFKKTNLQHAGIGVDSTNMGTEWPTTNIEAAGVFLDIGQPDIPQI